MLGNLHFSYLLVPFLLVLYLYAPIYLGFLAVASWCVVGRVSLTLALRRSGGLKTYKNYVLVGNWDTLLCLLQMGMVLMKVRRITGCIMT